jgi:NAD(P)H-hydrate epimerase
MSGEPGERTVVRLTRAQVREVDRLATEQYHVPGIVLMENASRAATEQALKMMVDFRVRNALILCGGGNNGGDGLAVARHLHNRGAEVTVALTIDPSRYQRDALVNWQIVQAMKLPVVDATPDVIRSFEDALVVDAIFGTGLSEPPRDPFAAIAEAIAVSENPVLAVDVPSGLDCDTGEPLGPTAVVADRTITFVAPKVGFANPAAARYLGEIVVGDIGCPRELIARVAAQA